MFAMDNCKEAQMIYQSYPEETQHLTAVDYNIIVRSPTLTHDEPSRERGLTLPLHVHCFNKKI